MSQQATEEDQNEHFFIKYMNNKVRNNQKKLKQINLLEQQETRNEDQQKKVDAKIEIEKNVAHYLSMLSTYKNAEKEYGIKRQQTQKQVKLNQFKQEEQIVVDAISFMMDLQYLAQYFSKGHLAPELQPHQEQINQIKQLYKRCFRLTGGRSQKLQDKLEQAKKIMVDVMYQEKEWKGITQNVKMLIKKDCVANSTVGEKEQKPSRKASSAVQRKMSNRQAEVKYEEKKTETANEEKKLEEPKKEQQKKKQEPKKKEEPKQKEEPQHKEEQKKEVKEQKVEEKQAEKKYVLTKIEPQDNQISRNRSKSNKKEDKPADNQKQPRKVTFDETNIRQEKADDFIEVKPRTQKKQDQQQQHYKKPYEKRAPKPYQKKKEFPNKERPKKQQQVVQYVQKGQQQQEQQE